MLQVLGVDAADARFYTATECESLRNHSPDELDLPQNSRFGTAICAGLRTPAALARLRCPPIKVFGRTGPRLPAVFDNPLAGFGDSQGVPLPSTGPASGPKFLACRRHAPLQAAVAAAENAAGSTFTPMPIVLDRATLRR